MKVSIRTTNPAFAANKADECGRLLVDLGRQLRTKGKHRLAYPAKSESIMLYDRNGEKCGTCRAS